MPEPDRPMLRNYTVRHLRPHVSELDIDFVVHDGGGAGCQWALRAEPGANVGVIDQHARYAPAPYTPWQLICGDETALPAIGGIVEAFPTDLRAEVFIEVPTDADVQHLPSAGDVRVRWLPREGTGRSRRGAALLDAVRAARLPAGTLSVWVAGEAGVVAGLRRHLVGDRGVDRDQALFSGYWRRNRPAYE